MAQAAADFSRPGPCAPQSWQPDFPVPSDLQAVQLPAKLRLNVTMPDCPATAEQAFGPAPSPVLFFFNGFMNRAGWYHRLMQRAASWGLVTVQYDTPFFPLLTVAAEVQLFPYLLQWVADQGDDPASPLYGRADMASVAVGGHSRGGKLATLAFTGNPQLVQAAYLVDPVDVTRWSPESADNPSAVRALAASGLAVGMTAAGVISSCNPADAGYQPMYAAAGNGSWLGIIPEASHSQFIDAGCVGNAAADLLCGKGSDSRRQVAELTATPMLAWLWDQLVGQQQQQADAANGTSAGSPLPSFFSWVLRQQQAGMLEFQVKREEADGLWADAAGQAPDETPVDAAEGMVESAAEEEECAPEPELAAFARALD
ncbi:hypothetical protein CHLNCDRAFT_153950 [Chlorella variabilis]|uniref:Uncharacterized protein CHL n=1 Tax=Chlorella variabilis TaxID=554065 RepID=E1Z3N9_CHLVA|nr:hypothetical protein CHLNCDRAFT_153950 [Chlorella variabilis]EFN59881.1 hypothetical protein CHLNCDRAFT_153950 [Chlorella variabilis]|eukprot:XP_005851983.1 hypothetical protein CHLNCDRAFT_153950 [Chlorella variabilis]